MITDIYSQLRRDEREVLHAYEDHLGYLTIGVGRLIDERKGGGISKDESQMLLSNDVESRRNRLGKALHWYRELDVVRQGVLLNMSFQLGVAGLLNFVNTLELLRRRDYTACAKAMLQSKWAKQTPERAYRLAEQMRTGEWK